MYKRLESSDIYICDIEMNDRLNVRSKREPIFELNTEWVEVSVEWNRL
jgi:hypothetical protein